MLCRGPDVTLSPILRAGLWMVGTMVSFATMAVCGRELAGGLTTFQILFWRSLVGVLILVVLLSHQGWAQVRTKNLKVHGFRNVVHFGAQYCWFFAVATIPLAEVVSLEFTTPLWTAVLAMLFLGESLRAKRLTAIALGFIGTLVIVRPGLGEVGFGTLAGLAAAFGYAVALTSVRFLAQRDTPLCLLFYMLALQLPLGFFPALGGWVWPGAADWPWILAVGVTGLTAHYCIARAMRLAEAAAVTTMGFMRLPLVALVGFALYGEVLELWVGLGATLICAGIYLNVRDESGRTA